MTYIIPKNVVVQTGTVDADTLCGLPCSFYLDFNNLTNVPTNLSVLDSSTATPGQVLTVDAYGDARWMDSSSTLPVLLRDGVTTMQVPLA